MSEEEEVYCLCKSTDISRFMIGCDKCDEWYHGDCIDVSAEDAKVIKKYFCNSCRNKNPGLKIRYKRKYREQAQLTKPITTCASNSASKNPTQSSSTATSLGAGNNTDLGKPSINVSVSSESSKDTLTMSHPPTKTVPKDAPKSDSSKQESSASQSSLSTSKESSIVTQPLSKSVNKSVDSNIKVDNSKKDKDRFNQIKTFTNDKKMDKAERVDRKKESGEEKEKVVASKPSGFGGGSKMLASILGGGGARFDKEKDKTSKREERDKVVIGDSTNREERKEKSVNSGNSFGKDKERKLGRSDDLILKDKPFRLGKSDAEKNLEKLLQAQLLKSEKIKIETSPSLSSNAVDKEKESSKKTTTVVQQSGGHHNSVTTSKTSPLQSIVGSSTSSQVCTVKSEEISPNSNSAKIRNSSDGRDGIVSKMIEKPDTEIIPNISGTLKEEFNDGGLKDIDEARVVSINDNTAKFDESTTAFRNDDNSFEYCHKRKKKRKYMDDSGYHCGGFRSASSGFGANGVSSVGFGSKNMQCYGPGCVNKSRRNSKYCCDDCGMALAKQRLLTILPDKISEWRQNPPVANEKDKQELEQVRKQKASVLTRVKELDVERQKLEKEISYARNLLPLPEDEEPNEDSNSSGDMFCFTCGQQISQTTALKHIERCFAKIETQTSYESKYPSNIPMLFCDAYNNRTKSFCKRLKIICPEHSSKDYKIGEDEVCGCPLPNAGEVVFDDRLSHEYCRVLKRKCFKHYKWEVMRIATIDAERVNNLIKYDELLEVEARIETSLKTRGSVMDLLLNSCIAH